MSEVIETDWPPLDRVREQLGERSFARGLQYAKQGLVSSLEWTENENDLLLTGTVNGSYSYETTAYFYREEDGRVHFDGGDCSCPMGYDCKHVAALTIAAQDRPGIGPTVTTPSWDQSIRQLLQANRRYESCTPLAVELSLTFNPEPQLLARPMKRGSSGSWINGSLTWQYLNDPEAESDGYRADHLSLLRSLSTAANAKWLAPTLELSRCGAELWPLLEEAQRLDLPLIHGHGNGNPLAPPLAGRVAFDVIRGDDDSRRIQAFLDIEEYDESAAVICFIGVPMSHGALCASFDEHGRPQQLQLVRLARPVSEELQRLMQDKEELIVPAAELERFENELCPALLRMAPIVSSDDSFRPPVISDPALLLHLRPGDKNSLEAVWEWGYEVNGELRSFPYGSESDSCGLRDPDREIKIAAELDLGDRELEQHRLITKRGQPADVSVVLKDLEAMRFATRALPALKKSAAVKITVDGELPEYRDVSDSLSLELSVEAIGGERDWFDLGITITVEGHELPFADVFVALAKGQSEMLLDDGAYFSLETAELQTLRELIEEARNLEDPSKPLRISRYQSSLWSELTSLGVVRQQAESWREQIEAIRGLEELCERSAPASLAATLRPYQQEGFNWLASLWELGLGGILADDMGLGKTVQALAMIAHARELNPALEPFLIVAPTSVVPNWLTEATRFLPGVRVRTISDTTAKSKSAITEIIGDADIVVTTYTLLRLDAVAYQSVEWAGVILDEAQYVKNHQSKTYNAARQLNARIKLALSGTPLENNLMELWSLLSITAPGLFPHPKQFEKQYAKPIERGDIERRVKLRSRIKPLLLRRCRELVADDLPEKEEQSLLIDLHADHRRVYDVTLQRIRQEILGLLADYNRNRIHIFAAITALRQLSLHAELTGGSKGSAAKGSVPCAKLDALVEQLDDVIAGGHRALIFSQFTGFFDHIRDRLDKEGISYVYLDGKTKKRAAVIKSFRKGAIPVFLLSLKAGGVGLNLPEADYCFLLDPWWNPAVEAQAIGRAHRSGQTRKVMAYRMISANTIEEKVAALAQRKAELFSSVLDDGDQFAKNVTADDIRSLFE